MHHIASTIGSLHNGCDSPRRNGSSVLTNEARQAGWRDYMLNSRVV